MQEPNFLVEAPDGRLYGYTRPDILRSDLASHRSDPPRRLFRLDRSSLVVAYEPVDVSEFVAVVEPSTAPAEIEGPDAPLQLKA